MALESYNKLGKKKEKVLLWCYFGCSGRNTAYPYPALMAPVPVHLLRPTALASKTVDAAV